MKFLWTYKSDWMWYQRVTGELGLLTRRLMWGGSRNGTNIHCNRNHFADPPGGIVVGNFGWRTLPFALFLGRWEAIHESNSAGEARFLAGIAAEAIAIVWFFAGQWSSLGGSVYTSVGWNSPPFSWCSFTLCNWCTSSLSTWWAESSHSRHWASSSNLLVMKNLQRIGPYILT